jgi:hypothetical protein
VDNFVLTATGVAGTIQGEPALQFSSPTLSFTGTGSPTLGASQIYLNGGTSNRIDFNQNGAGAPAFTTRSAGTKIALYPNISASNVDIGLGYMADGGAPSMWYSILSPTSNGAFYWYAGTTQIMALVNLAAGTRRLDLTAGTLANPAISAGLNSSDTNTGIYFPAGDTIGFVEGGAEAMRIDANGTVNYLAGTVSSPSINAGLNASDTNTGIYFPAGDTIGFVEGGTEAMRIDSNGRINLLAGTIANPILNAGLNSTDTDTGLYFPAANSLGLVTGGIEIIRFSGNTTSFSGGTVSLPTINAGLNSNDTNTGIYFPSSDTIGFATSGTSRSIINNTGFGIQTTPSAWIHLSSSPILSNWIRFDAARNANVPPENNAGPPDTGIGTNGAINKYLQEPDVWMEVILDSAGKGGAVVLIPCYLPG